MNLSIEYATQLCKKLREVPINHGIPYQWVDALNEDVVADCNFPVGKYCHDAAYQLEAALKQLSKSKGGSE